MNEFVVGVDGSDHGRMALRWAAAAAGAAGVPVRAVQSWIHPRAAILPIAPVPVSAEEMDEQAHEAIAAVATDTLGSSDAVTIDVLRGPPAGALLRTVTPDSVLVLGSRGLGGFAGLLLGSVSQECIEYASCPVVVVRTERIVGDGDVILVGKDGSEGAQRALAWAHALASATGARLRAVHAWRAAVSERPPRTGERLRSQAADAVRGWTQEVADEIETGLVGAGATAATALLRDPPPLEAAIAAASAAAACRSGRWPLPGKENTGKLCTACVGDLLYCLRRFGVDASR